LSSQASAFLRLIDAGLMRVKRVRLRRGVALEVQPASAKHSRGMTAIGIVLDCAFLPSNEDAANSDVDILTALRPSLSTTGAPLLLTSSPATTTGICHSLWQKHYGAEGDPLCLVVQSDSLGLNPTLRKSVIDRAYEMDAAAAAAEWGGEFREPLSAFLSRELVERCVERGISERQPLPGIAYSCFIDSAGGSGTDSFTACVGHRSRDADRDVIVVDAVYEVIPPFDPLAVVAALAGHFKRWNITQVHGRQLFCQFHRQCVWQVRHHLRAVQVGRERAIPRGVASLHIKHAGTARRAACH
jgi:hypothetical protein